MWKEEITYTDFNGDERTEDFFFNLTKAEVLEMEFSREGGWSVYAERIIKTKSMPGLFENFKKIVLKAFGVKSDDGRRFMKSEEISREFMETPAFDVLLMKLVSDEKAAAAFMNGIIPQAPEESKPSIPAPPLK